MNDAIFNIHAFWVRKNMDAFMFVFCKWQASQLTICMYGKNSIENILHLQQK